MSANQKRCSFTWVDPIKIHLKDIHDRSLPIKFNEI